jgi:ferredoxin/menaquinone-dependent protoporphyrinogen IX oxidase
MNINKVNLIYFSATGTTEKVLNGIAQGIGAEEIEHIDLTPANAAQQTFTKFSDELVILGAPVYGGRLPIQAIERFKRLQGQKTPAVLVVVYGNREFEDALLEMKNLTIDLGFQPLAAAAFIGEHSFASDEIPIANGRPDDLDIKKAMEFGKMISVKAAQLQSTGKNTDLNVPGTFPYSAAGAKALEVSPITIEDVCTLCGTCATVCPTGAITVNEDVSTLTKECIRCCACIKNCPTGARVIGHDEWKHIVNWLKEHCSERKEPQLFGI